MEEGSLYPSDICHQSLPTVLFHRQDTYLPFTILYVVEKNSCLSTGFAGLKGLYILKAQPPPFNSIISKTVSTKEALPVCYGRFVSFTFAPGNIFMKVGQATGHRFCNMAELIPADNVALQVIRQRTLQNRTLSVLSHRPLYVTDVPAHQFREWFRECLRNLSLDLTGGKKVTSESKKKK